MSVRSTTYSKASSKFRISNKRKEISFCPISTNAFSRISSELGRYESVPSNPKNSKIQKLCKGGKKFSKNNSEKTIRINRKSDSFNSSNFSSPTTLQTFTGRKKSKAQPDSQLQFRTSPISKSSKRIKLVDTPVNSLEWEVSNFHPTICNHPNRCKQCGMGAVMNKVSIGGPWLQSEKSFHINALELIAVTHAVKSFLKDRHNLQVLIQTDNITTMTYINKMGGTVSKVCNKLALELWTWCLQKDIVLKADFIPGRENLIADWESRHHSDSSNWKLHSKVFNSLMKQTMTCNIDLFADRSNNQLQTYISWLPDPGALAFNALLHPWTSFKAYAFPLSA
ncbi:Hypothetical predicted protein [Mytilus galloprovincialis]|uniref:RNase H type-1 domain-containing protein n=1 Tax=Mytilus galloprovincialis TaxID=29158 RepID=A0A8B6HMU8_MYTGA|nr:Hypothetical predicted protein [Mytilus galloprovincialis]